MLNKYVNRLRISEKKFRGILCYFSSDLELTKISEITSVLHQWN